MQIYNNKKGRFLFIAILSIATCFALLGCGAKDTTSDQKQNPKTTTVHGSYIIDVNDVNALVGDADYVFIGKVLKQDGVKDVSDTTEMAYTQYQIQVIENIKGSLITDQPIEIEKAGGYSEKEQVNYLYEDDFLPEKDEIYIFYAYAQPDGSLEVSGPNSNVKLNSNKKTRSARSYQDEEEYQEVVDALDSQIIRERDRSVSKYEKE